MAAFAESAERPHQALMFPEDQYCSITIDDWLLVHDWVLQAEKCVVMWALATHKPGAATARELLEYGIDRLQELIDARRQMVLPEWAS